METEIEAKFTNINVAEMRSRLKEGGAQLVTPERLMTRINFDWQDNELLDGENAWVRVRDEGDKVTMTYKRVLDRTLHGTKEANVTIDSFESGRQFLKALGMEERVFQETKRESWLLDACEVTIDTWPWVPSFLEIEGPSEMHVRAVATKLGCDWSAAMFGSVETVYQEHYDVTEAEIDHWESITFIPVPEWLEIKRKNN